MVKKLLIATTGQSTRALQLAKRSIKEGGVVICPTDTIYGLIADATNKDAVKKVFGIKKRYPEKPVPVFVRNVKVAKSLANINIVQEEFLRKFWPGKVTTVLKAKAIRFPRGILSKDGKIGLRIPNYRFLNMLLDKLNCPLVATSANISGKEASVKIKDILKQFKNQKYQPDLILDAGDLKSSLPSAVVDLTNFKVLREGEATKTKLYKIFLKDHENKL